MAFLPKPIWSSMFASCLIRTSFRSFANLPASIPRSLNMSATFLRLAEFLEKTTEMMKFLLPHYIKEGKSYLTVACWLYRWTASVSLHCRGDEEAADLSRISGEDRASRYAPLVPVPGRPDEKTTRMK